MTDTGSDLQDAYNEIADLKEEIERLKLEVRTLKYNLKSAMHRNQTWGVYAEQLACVLAEKHFPEETQWKPESTLMGLLAQIDSMTAGMTRKKSVRVGEITPAMIEAGVNALLRPVLTPHENRVVSIFQDMTAARGSRE